MKLRRYADVAVRLVDPAADTLGQAIVAVVR